MRSQRKMNDDAQVRFARLHGVAAQQPRRVLVLAGLGELERRRGPGPGPLALALALALTLALALDVSAP